MRKGHRRTLRALLLCPLALALPLPALTANDPGPAQILHLHKFGGPDKDYVHGVGFFEDNPDDILVGGVYTDGMTLPSVDGGTIELPDGGGIQSAYTARLRLADGHARWVFTVSGPNDQIGFSYRQLANGDFFVRGTMEGTAKIAPVADGVEDEFDTPIAPPGAWTEGQQTKVPFHGILSTDGILQHYDLGMGNYSNFSNEIAPGLDNSTFALGTTRFQLTFNVGLPTELRLPRFSQPVETFDFYLLKYDDQARVQWGRISWGPGEDTAAALATHPDGGVVAAGRYSENLVFNRDETDEFTLGPVMARTIGGTTYRFDGWVARWDDEGYLLWARQYGGPRDDRIHATQVLPDGDILIAGSIGQGASFEGTHGAAFTPFVRGARDPFIARLRESDGKARWVTTLTSVSDREEAYTMTISPDAGRVWVGGEYGANLLYGAQVVATHFGALDGFVAEFDTVTGAFRRIYTIRGTAGNNSVYRLQFRGADQLFAMGEFTGSAQVNVGNQTRGISSTGVSDGFLLVLDVGVADPPPPFPNYQGVLVY